MNTALRLLPLFAVAAALAGETSGPAPKPGKADAPAESRKVLAVHKTDAEFTGIVNQPCRHRTADCPDKCDHGGAIARFKILAYRSHEKRGEYGEDKVETHAVRLRNTRGEARLDAALLAQIESLKPGAKVELDWTHDYVTRDGASFPERPITRLKIAGEAATPVNFLRLDGYFVRNDAPVSATEPQGFFLSDAAAFDAILHPAPLNGRSVPPVDFKTRRVVAFTVPETNRDLALHLSGIHRDGDTLVVRVRESGADGPARSFTIRPLLAVTIPVTDPATVVFEFGGKRLPARRR